MPSIQSLFVAGLLLLLQLPAPALAQQDPGAAAVLQPGDLIVLEVWREKELSDSLMVAPSGTAVFPLLGERQVAGRPFDEVRDQLLSEYARELRNPSITVTPLRRVYVLGEVNEAGLYSLDLSVSLAGAVAMAGGASEQGDLRRIRVVRDGEVVLRGVRAETSISTIGVRSGDQVFVGRRSWFDRNSTFIVSALITVTSIAISLMR